jgi:hypothetical protein
MAPALLNSGEDLMSHGSSARSGRDHITTQEVRESDSGPR